MAHTIPILFEPEPAALSRGQAMRYIGVGSTKLWELENLPSSNPRRIRKTSYGMYPVAELDRHIKAEMERKAA